MFSVNIPGPNALHALFRHMRSADAAGLTSRIPPEDNPSTGSHEPYDAHQRNGGPGQPIDLFLTKRAPSKQELLDSFPLPRGRSCG